MEETGKSRIEDLHAFPSEEEIEEALEKLPQAERRAVERRMQELDEGQRRLRESRVRLEEEVRYLDQEVDDMRDALQRVEEKSRIVRNLLVHGTSPQLESEQQALELVEKFFLTKCEDVQARIAKVEQAMEALEIELRKCGGEVKDVLRRLGFPQPQGDKA